MSEKPLLYVCSMSAFNLPEFESCLLRKPTDLVLLVSNAKEIISSAKLFEQAINKHLPRTQVHVLGGEEQGFDGRNLASFQTWLAENALPYIKQAKFQNHQKACNITGGTKPMSLLLANAEIVWDWLDYKAEESFLQEFELNQGKVSLQKNHELPSATAQQVAMLYSDKFKEVLANPISQLPLATQVAKDLYQGLKDAEPGLVALLGDENKGLRAAWIHNKFAQQKHPTKPDLLAISADEFIEQTEFSSEQLAWLNSWQQLADARDFQVDNHKITLPSAKAKSNFKRWLMADWFEQLAKTWLRDAGVPEDALASNLKINAEDDKEGRESDLLVHFQGKTSLIEIKVDLPPGGKFSDMIRQVSSMRNRLGRSKKILLIGPGLAQRLTENELKGYKSQAKAEGVVLCYDQPGLVAEIIGDKFTQEERKMSEQPKIKEVEFVDFMEFRQVFKAVWNEITKAEFAAVVIFFAALGFGALALLGNWLDARSFDFIALIATLATSLPVYLLIIIRMQERWKANLPKFLQVKYTYNGNTKIKISMIPLQGESDIRNQSQTILNMFNKSGEFFSWPLKNFLKPGLKKSVKTAKGFNQNKPFMLVESEIELTDSLENPSDDFKVCEDIKKLVNKPEYKTGYLYSFYPFDLKQNTDILQHK